MLSVGYRCRSEGGLLRVVPESGIDFDVMKNSKFIDHSRPVLMYYCALVIIFHEGLVMYQIQPIVSVKVFLPSRFRE